jgi:hypothetical protein
LVVVAAELNTDTESALATVSMPLMENKAANIANLVFTAASLPYFQQIPECLTSRQSGR